MGDMGAIFSEDGVVETFQNDKEALAAAESNVAVSAPPEHRFPLEMDLSRSLFLSADIFRHVLFPKSYFCTMIANWRAPLVDKESSILDL